MHTWNDIYKLCKQQPEFHKNGLISRTAMRIYKPKHILLSGSTPPNQCLGDTCENCELIRKALLASGIKNIPSNKYSCVDSTLCNIRQGKFGTSYTFPPMACIKRECTDCGKKILKELIENSNNDILTLNKKITWHRWQVVKGRSVPQKLEIKGTLKSAINEFLDMIESIAGHLFRANWNRKIF